MAIKFLNDQLFPTDVFLVDVSAGRVGINTLLPRTALEVVGTLRVWSGLNTHTYVETSSASNLGSIQGKKNSDDAVRALALNPLGGNIGINLGAGVLPTSSLHVAGNVRVTGAYYDSNNSPGTAGQVLSSTATGTDWVAAGTGTITGVARENRISFGSATQNDITHDEDFTIVQTANEERIKIANGGVQVADMSALPVASLAGSLRYRVFGQASFVDMCMQTSPGGYSWVNIVQNSWTI